MPIFGSSSSAKKKLRNIKNDSKEDIHSHELAVNSSNSSVSSVDYVPISPLDASASSTSLSRSHSMTNKFKNMFKNTTSPKPASTSPPLSPIISDNVPHSPPSPLLLPTNASSTGSVTNNAGPKKTLPMMPVIEDIEEVLSNSDISDKESLLRAKLQGHVVSSDNMFPKSPTMKNYIQEGHLYKFPNNTHEHIIKANKKQEKLPAPASGYLTFSLSAFTKAKHVIENSYSLIDDGDLSRLPPIKNLESDFDDNNECAIGQNQLDLIRKLTSKIERGDCTVSENLSLIEKYGKPKAIIGRGAYGIVKVVAKTHPITKKDVFFAVKELKKKDSEDMEHFSGRLVSEFLISSTLNHPNIIKTIDLMKDPTSGKFGEIMEYCHGGDLYGLILENGNDGLPVVESECFIKQITRGVVYMHQHGVAHCDLKPENILITVRGCCKIIDFGTSVVFKTAWDKDAVLSKGACGSEPYVAPEEYTQESYDPVMVDYWAIGIIYMTMMTGSFLWKSPKKNDELFSEFLKVLPKYETSSEGQLKLVKKGSFDPIESLKKDLDSTDNMKIKKKLLYKLLNPDPKKRLTGRELLESEWMKSVNVCVAGSGM